MLFMVIEHFRPGRATEVYLRFRDRGRMAPDGLRYISSWVDLRATFYTSGMGHSATSATGTAWERTPWRAVQQAAVPWVPSGPPTCFTLPVSLLMSKTATPLPRKFDT